MCPPAPPTPSIGDYVDDKEMFSNLQSLTHGGPIPENVLIDVNPSTSAPWDLPPRMLFFFNSKDAKVNRVTEKGYWQAALKDPSMLTRSPNMGMLTTLEFYTGQAPYGDKTDWMMHEYTIDRKSSGSSSLCRVFNQNDRSHAEQHQQLVAHDSINDSVQFWLSLQPKNDLNLQDSSSNSQVPSRNEHGLSKISGSDLQNLIPDNSSQHPNEACVFSNGEFLELNDLSDLSSSSSCSVNTCITFKSSEQYFEEEYFDPEALLRELETPAISDSNPEYFDSEALLHELETKAGTATNQRNADCHFNVAASRGSCQVFMQPPPSGSIGSGNYLNPHTNGTVVSASGQQPISIGVVDTTLSAASAIGKEPDRKALKHGSAACEVNQGGPSTSESAIVHGKRKAVGMIAKLRKKCCCFIPF